MLTGSCDYIYTDIVKVIASFTHSRIRAVIITLSQTTQVQFKIRHNAYFYTALFQLRDLKNYLILPMFTFVYKNRTHHIRRSKIKNHTKLEQLKADIKIRTIYKKFNVFYSKSRSCLGLPFVHGA